MKYVLMAVLFFVTIPGTHGEEGFTGVALPKFDINAKSKEQVPKEKAKEEESSDSDQLAEVELLRMVSPSGNEVVFSLSSKVMGRNLDVDDFTVPGVEVSLTNTRLCQMTVSDELELQRAEIKLELDLLIEDLKSKDKPRFLSQTQRDILAKVPTCEVFKLHLTAISKMMQGYDYSELAFTTVR